MMKDETDVDWIDYEAETTVAYNPEITAFTKQKIQNTIKKFKQLRKEIRCNKQ